ncbi:MAG: hypothetical protein Q8P23_04565 [bacterium]|nr:hypothetical protein [bacterium]
MNKLLAAVGVVILLNVGIIGFVYAAYKDVVPTPQFLRGIFLDKKINSVYEQYCSEKQTIEPVAVIMGKETLGQTFGDFKKKTEVWYENKEIEKVALTMLIISAAYNYVAPGDLQAFKDEWPLMNSDLNAKSDKIKNERYQFIQDTSKQDTKTLLDNLSQNKYSEWEVPVVLRIVGQGLTQERSFDSGFKLHTCNAGKYYDPFSMYYLARVYAAGSEEIKAASPELVVKMPIAKDLKEAYFWFSAMRDSSSLHMEDVGDQESMSAFRESLESALSEEERNTIDQTRSRTFISAHYPQYRELLAVVRSMLK